jgi:hypothetical protein
MPLDDQREGAKGDRNRNRNTTAQCNAPQQFLDSQAFGGLEFGVQLHLPGRHTVGRDSIFHHDFSSSLFIPRIGRMLQQLSQLQSLLDIWRAGGRCPTKVSNGAAIA